METTMITRLGFKNRVGQGRRPFMLVSRVFGESYGCFGNPSLRHHGVNPKQVLHVDDMNWTHCSFELTS